MQGELQSASCCLTVRMRLRRAGSKRHEDEEEEEEVEEVRKREGESAAFEVQLEADSVPREGSVQFSWMRDDAELMLSSRNGVSCIVGH